MTTKTTTHLIITTRDLIVAHIRAYLAQRDPLAVGSLAIVAAILAIAIGRAGYLAIAGSFPTMPAAAAGQPLRPIILIATPAPLHVASTAAPTPDPLRAELEALRQRVAELEAAPTVAPEIVYVAQQPAPPAAPAPILIAPTPEPPRAEDPPPPPPEAPQGGGGSGQSVAPDFQPLAPPSGDAAQRWCAAAASVGIAKCKEQP